MTWMFIQHFLYVLFTDHTPSRPYLPVLVHHSISLWLHYCVVVPKNDSKEGITLFAHPVCSDRHSKVTAFQPMPMQSWVKPKLVVDWPSHKNPFNGKKTKNKNQDSTRTTCRSPCVILHFPKDNLVQHFVHVMWSDTARLPIQANIRCLVWLFKRTRTRLILQCK